MSTKNELQNYLVKIKDYESDKILLETTIQGIRRSKGDFMLLDLYEEYSPDYQEKEYPDTIELKETKQMDVSLSGLILRLNSKVSTKDLLLNKGKDGIYLYNPARISSWEEAEEIIKQWFISTYFHIRTGCTPIYLESFGNYILKMEGLSSSNHVSLIDDYVEWIKEVFHLNIVVELIP